MIRLFLPPEKLCSPEVVISGEDARYLTTVLRAKTGDMVTILDGLGKKYVCEISEVSPRQVTARKISEELFSAESPVSVTLLQGIPKGSKMDLIIQKATELGVSRIVPLITERTIVKDTGKTLRWIKIARSASQQSGRDKVPDVLAPVRFHDFFKVNREDISPSASGRGLILSETETGMTFRKALKDFQSVLQITLIVGPEGGFSREEVQTAVQSGFVPVSLGPRILRTETAPLTAISIIQYEFGDLG